MASRIVHFGMDECLRLAVLSRAGYLVEASGTSRSLLSDLLTKGPTDVIAISEDDCECDQEVIRMSRSLSSAPIVLFEGVYRSSDLPAVELVIAQQMFSPSEWLQKIENLVQQTKETCEQSKGIRDQSRELRKHSQAIRSSAAAARRGSVRDHVRFEGRLEGDGPQGKNRERWQK